MNSVGKPERETQDWVILLFRDELGYRHLGDWSDSTRGLARPRHEMFVGKFTSCYRLWDLKARLFQLTKLMLRWSEGQLD